MFVSTDHRQGYGSPLLGAVSGVFFDASGPSPLRAALGFAHRVLPALDPRNPPGARPPLGCVLCFACGLRTFFLGCPLPLCGVPCRVCGSVCWVPSGTVNESVLGNYYIYLYLFTPRESPPSTDHRQNRISAPVTVTPVNRISACRARSARTKFDLFCLKNPSRELRYAPFTEFRLPLRNFVLSA